MTDFLRSKTQTYANTLLLILSARLRQQRGSQSGRETTSFTSQEAVQANSLSTALVTEHHMGTRIYFKKKKRFSFIILVFSNLLKKKLLSVISSSHFMASRVWSAHGCSRLPSFIPSVFAVNQSGTAAMVSFYCLFFFPFWIICISWFY